MSANHTDMRAGFIERACVALLLAICVGVLLETSRFVIGYPNAFAFATSAAATIYAAWLVIRSRERRALLLVSACWVASVIMLLAFFLPPLLHIAALLVMLWVVRALYVYRRPLDAMLDAGLMLFALMTGIWALSQTASAAAATWSVFLVMAVFVRLPTQASTEPNNESSSDRFDRAKAAADQAVANLSHS